MKYLVFISFVVGAGLVYLLSSASANTDFFAQHFSWLLFATGVLAAAMVALVGYQILQLRKKMRAGIFGTKLTVRLMLAFGLMAFLPGAVVYAVSVQFLSRSIESWFDVRVDTALSSGLNLGQAVLDNLQRELARKADSMAQTLAEGLRNSNVVRVSNEVQANEVFSIMPRALFDKLTDAGAHFYEWPVDGLADDEVHTRCVLSWATPESDVQSWIADRLDGRKA